VSAWCE